MKELSESLQNDNKSTKHREKATSALDDEKRPDII